MRAHPPIDDPRAVLNSLLREDFCAFLRKAAPYIMGGSPLMWNWHLDAIAYELERIRCGHNRFLIVNLPPRNLKSIAVSVAWVAWMLGRDPRLSFLCVSYSGELAAKLARLCRAIMMSGWYRELFPRTIISDTRSATHDFETSAGGGRFATSPTGTLTGRGGDIIIIDDPIKPEEALSDTTRMFVNDWFSSTLASRLNDKNKGAIILVMQRLHEEDLAGMLLEQGDWAHLTLPAVATASDIIRLTRGRVHRRTEGDILHPEREGQAALDAMKRTMGSMPFSAQYQQEPVPETGNMLQRTWLKTYTAGQLPAQGQIVQSWDTASKDAIHNDWSVCITARIVNDTAYIIDVFRKKLEFPALRREAIRLARLHGAQVLLIEDAASGTQLIQTLRAEAASGVPRPIACKSEGDKRSRFSGITSLVEAGQLLLPYEAPWLATFQHEILAFPSGRHDDQADALAQLLIWMRNRPRFSVSDEGAQIPPERPHWEQDLDDEEDGWWGA